MPSAMLRSLMITDSRNGASFCELMRKFRLGVEMKQRRRWAIASRTRCTAPAMSRASNGRPSRQ
jgi:hypothetical protein